MRSDCLVLCSVVTNVYCFCSYITKYSHADFKAIPTKPSAYLTGFSVISNCQELSLAQMLRSRHDTEKVKILSTLSIARFADIVQCDIVHVPSFSTCQQSGNSFDFGTSHIHLGKPILTSNEFWIKRWSCGFLYL